jgi:hypothetical protein
MRVNVNKVLHDSIYTGSLITQVLTPFSALHTTDTQVRHAAVVSTIACGWQEAQAEYMGVFKGLIDSGCTDGSRVPEELLELGVAALISIASTCSTGELAVVAPFPTSKEGLPVLMIAMLQLARAQLEQFLQDRVVILPLLARAVSVERRSALSRAERAQHTQEHADTVTFVRSSEIPSGPVKYVTLDDVADSGASLETGMCTHRVAY